MASETISSMTCNIRLDNGTSATGKQLVKSHAIGPALDPDPDDGATKDRLYAVAQAVKKLYEETLIDVVKTVKSTLAA